MVRVVKIDFCCVSWKSGQTAVFVFHAIHVLKNQKSFSRLTLIHFSLPHRRADARELLSLFDWLSEVWRHINQILEDYCDSEATLGL